MLGPRSSLEATSASIIDKAQLIELLMLCHVFSSEETVFFKLLCTELLSAQRTSSLHYFNSGDALRKKTSKPRIRVEMLDGWEDVERIIKACPTFLEIIKIELTSHCGIEKTRELVARRLRRPAVGPDTYSLSEGHQLRFDSRHRRSAYKNDTLQAGADND